MQRGQPQILIHEADRKAREACMGLQRAFPDLKELTPAGRLRRGCETIGELVIVAHSENTTRWAPQQFISQFNVRLVVSDADHFGIALLLSSGSQQHLEELRELAIHRGYKLDERGLWRAGREIICPDEAAVYAALGLPVIPPELRESGEEVGLALRNKLPTLTALEDLRGIVHNHTNFSDGANTLDEMAETARSAGYQYFGVADHSRSAHYANGLQIERIVLQHQEIDRLNAGYQGQNFQILKGIESDIRRDGSLDYPPDVLASFDYIVCSVHDNFSLSSEEQTERVVRAVSHPRITILAHMTGRLLPNQEGYKLDIEEVLKACAYYGVAVEINSNPRRLDLDWRWHDQGLELGCLFSINPDAHSTEEIARVRWGVLAARKGGVPPDRVLNCMDTAALKRHFAKRAQR